MRVIIPTLDLKIFGFREIDIINLNRILSSDTLKDYFELEAISGQLFDFGAFVSYIIENIDATIIAQRPKMRPHIEQMRENIANVLQIDVSQVNVKATTEEGLGFTGSGEGIASQAVCLLESVRNLSYGGNGGNVYAYDAGMEAGTACAHCSGCHKRAEK